MAAATTMTRLGYTAEYEPAQNSRNHRQFWRYHIRFEPRNEKLFSGAAGDLQEAVNAVNAYMRYLTEQKHGRRDLTQALAIDAKIRCLVSQISAGSSTSSCSRK